MTLNMNSLTSSYHVCTPKFCGWRHSRPSILRRPLRTLRYHTRWFSRWHFTLNFSWSHGRDHRPTILHTLFFLKWILTTRPTVVIHHSYIMWWGTSSGIDTCSREMIDIKRYTECRTKCRGPRCNRWRWRCRWLCRAVGITSFGIIRLGTTPVIIWICLGDVKWFGLIAFCYAFSRVMLYVVNSCWWACGWWCWGYRR